MLAFLKWLKQSTINKLKMKEMETVKPVGMNVKRIVVLVSNF